MFSCKSCIVSGLKFSSLIHFEVSIVCGLGRVLILVFLHVAVPFS